MDAPVGLIFVISILIVAWFVFFLVKAGKENKRRYREALDRLKLDLTNPEIREEALRHGRKLIPHTGNPKLDGLFTEVSVMNDINAASARATIQVPQTSAAEQLQLLAGLVREGLLSQQEFDKAKSQVISASRSEIDEAAKLLRQLHVLFKEGVLSESEFKMKKWDVLARRIGLQA